MKVLAMKPARKQQELEFKHPDLSDSSSSLHCMMYEAGWSNLEPDLKSRNSCIGAVPSMWSMGANVTYF